MRGIVLTATLALTATAHAQSLTLQVETGPSLADGVLSPGEVASFTVRAFGTAPPEEPYRAFAALLEFGFGELGPGQFRQTGMNTFLTGLPGSPGLVYDDNEGRISMLDTGGFLNFPHLGTPLDLTNPIFMFSFDWFPSGYDGRTVDWIASGDEGSIYYGGEPLNGPSWTHVELDTVGPANGSFIVVPAPGAASVAILTGLLAANRRRRAP